MYAALRAARPRHILRPAAVFGTLPRFVSTSPPPWFVDPEDDPSPPSATFDRRPPPPHIPSEPFKLPENIPEPIRVLYDTLKGSPFLEPDTLVAREPLKIPHGPRVLERQPNGRRRIRRRTYGGESTLDLGSGGLWNWVVMAQVKEGTENRGSIESVVRVVRKTLLSMQPPVALPQKSAKSRPTGGWAMIDAGNFAVHIMSKEARAKYFENIESTAPWNWIVPSLTIEMLAREWILGLEQLSTTEMSESDQAKILTLPNELTALIFDELEIRSLVACRQVCKSFSTIAKDTKLQYRIALFLAGMQDGPRISSDLGSNERLLMLDAHQQAWSTLTWTAKDCLALRGDTWEFYGGVVATATGGSIVFKQISSKLRGLPKRHEWTFDSPGPCRDFTMEPAQDLLVILDLDEAPVLRLYSLSTGSVHPRAESHFIRMEGVDREMEAPNIKVHGRYLGIMHSSSGPGEHAEFRVYDWYNGTLCLYLPAGPADMRCFAFLPDEVVVVACCLDQVTAFLRMWPLKSGSAHMPLCTLRLPSCGYRVMLLDLTLSSDPPSEASSAAFSTPPRDILYTLTFDAWSGEQSRKALFFIPLSTLLIYASTDPLSMREEVAWPDWGPTGTRCIMTDPDLSDIWTCHTAGLRCVVAHISPRKSKTPSLRVYDFSAKRSFVDDPQHVQAVISSNTIPASKRMFVPEVQTSLPVRFVEVDLDKFEGKWKAAMMSEDSIVLVNADEKEFWIYSF
ncbi:hypothetical protein HWV62_30115 [Athelia sp. TMB]|nr:hypothetical protein HWV62_30115 [Athelia sp. TMB]